jgi:hypothetical protein
MSQDSACPTRQQLDELEALMQRMLSLPVSEGEEPAAPPAPPEPKSRAAVLPPRLRAIPDPPPWDDAAPVNDVPPPSPRLIARPVEVRAPRGLAAAAPPVVHSERVSIEEEIANVPEMPATQTAEPDLAAVPQQPRPRVKPRIAAKRHLVAREPEELWWLAPLVWTNHAFDRCTLRLGSSGRWLRGARGRSWIGWSGILLFALAAAWAALEWLGLMW